MFIFWLEFCLYVLFPVIIISQVIIPLIRGTILFPFLRSEKTALDREKAHLKEEIEAAKEKKELENLKQTLKENML